MKKMCALVLAMLMVFLAAGCVTVEAPAFPGFATIIDGTVWLSITPAYRHFFVYGYINGQFDIASRNGRFEEMRDDIGIPLQVREIAELIAVWYRTTGSLGTPFIEVFRAVQAQDWEVLMEEAEQPINAPMQGGV